MDEPIEIASESAMVACDIGTRWEVRCAHGTTPYLEIPGGYPQSEEQIRQQLIARHQERYGCDCGRTPQIPNRR